MCELTDFIGFANKIKERLIIVLDEKIARKEALNDADEYFLYEIYRQYVTNDKLERYCKPDFNPDNVSEQELF